MSARKIPPSCRPRACLALAFLFAVVASVGRGQATDSGVSPAAPTSSITLAAPSVPPAAVEALRLGNLAADAKQWAVALRHFDEARAVAPDLPGPLLSLGLAEEKLPGRELRAIGWFRAYLALAPDAPKAAAVRDEIDQLDIAAEGRANEILAMLTLTAAQFPAGGGQAGDAQSALAAVTAAITRAGTARPTPPSPDVPMSSSQRAQAWVAYVQGDLGAPLFLNYQAALAQAQAVSGSADNRAWTVFTHIRELADSWVTRLAEERGQFPEQRFVAGILAERARQQALIVAEQQRKQAEARLAALQADLPAAFAALVSHLAADTGIKLVPIPAGTFMMGSPSDEAGRSNDEGPQTRVTLTKDFYLGATDVTQGQYEAVIGNNPSNFKNAGKDAPVEQVSWDDAMAFCQKLTERERATGRLPEGYAFTLPTEAQWEYACRAGTNGPYAGDLDAMAWYGKNSGATTHPVGTKQPNAWGLYDMHGNVWEWCADWYVDKLPGGAVTDPTGPTSGSFRVNRGGSWYRAAAGCRSAFRSNVGPGNRFNRVGFRLALSSVR